MERAGESVNKVHQKNTPLARKLSIGGALAVLGSVALISLTLLKFHRSGAPLNLKNVAILAGMGAIPVPLFGVYAVAAASGMKKTEIVKRPLENVKPIDSTPVTEMENPIDSAPVDGVNPIDSAPVAEMENPIDSAPAYQSKEVFARACQSHKVEGLKYEDFQTDRGQISCSEWQSTRGASKPQAGAVNEDLFYSANIEGVGQVACVVDGHSDKGEVGELVEAHLSRLIQEALENNEMVEEALQQAVDQLDALYYLEVVKRNHDPARAGSGGAALAITFIPEESNTLYAATLGDCEVALLRGGKLAPLSLARDWNSTDERKRAEDYKKGIPNENPIKGLVLKQNSRGQSRFPSSSTRGAAETAGSIGDFLHKFAPPAEQYTTQYYQNVNLGKTLPPSSNPILPEGWQKMITTKAHIVKVVLQPGDKIVMGSDGLFDNFAWENLEATLNAGADTEQLLTAAKGGNKVDDITAAIQEIGVANE